MLSTQDVKVIRREFDVDVDEEVDYTDSKVVLGYIQNESRRFYVYVANRVQAIRNVSDSSQWKYIESENNPADLATRYMSPDKLMDSRWMTGPEALWSYTLRPQPPPVEIALDENDPEVRRQILVNTTTLETHQNLGCARFRRFSRWSSLRRAIANLVLLAKTYKRQNGEVSNQEKVTILCPSVAVLEQASKVLIGAAQREAFATELQALSLNHEKKSLPKESNLLRLDPFVDADGLLRVGGRVRNSTLVYHEKHPLLLPMCRC